MLWFSENKSQSLREYLLYPRFERGEHMPVNSNVRLQILSSVNNQEKKKTC